MSDPFFFGYGSLVNSATHDYPEVTPAVAQGWRRAWVQTSLRPVAILSAVPAPGHQIEGVIAAVPGGDWDALDLREQYYERLHDHSGVTHAHPAAQDIAIYAVPSQSHVTPEEPHPIFLSYLDVVLQGYLRQFGAEGAQRFVDTTDGWEAPILDDREDPFYPRHQMLTHDETGFVDNVLYGLGATIVSRGL